MALYFFRIGPSSLKNDMLIFCAPKVFGFKATIFSTNNDGNALRNCSNELSGAFKAFKIPFSMNEKAYQYYTL